MEIQIYTQNLKDLESELLLVPIFKNEKLEKKVAELDKAINGLIKETIESKDFSGKTKETLLLIGQKPLQTSRVLLVGLGERKNFTAETARTCLAAAAPYISKFKIKNLGLLLTQNRPQKTTQENYAQLAVEVLEMSLYNFLEYKKTVAEDLPEKLAQIQIAISSPAVKAATLKGAKSGYVIAQAVNYARSLANHPGNFMTPQSLADEAVKLAKQHNLKHQVLEKEDMKKLGMGALLGVNQGSALPPKFIIIEYAPRAKKFAKAKPVVLVGKGITFDSGGISIKPSRKMEEMKFDMCGAATVLGVIKAAAELSLQKKLVALIPATENLPSGTAIKPGDVVRAMNGKTIQVTNTDAEGRMILADALSYADRYKPETVVDYATLTGAIVVALGTEYTGAFSNKPALMKKLEAASERSGEKIWPLPLASEYREKIKSPIADIDNIGTQEGAGSITAALILEEFVNYPWIHLDIAGTAWTTTPRGYNPVGATGAGVRTTLEFLK